MSGTVNGQAISEAKPLYVPDDGAYVCTVPPADLSAAARYWSEKPGRRGDGIYVSQSQNYQPCADDAAFYPQMLGAAPDKCETRLLAFDTSAERPTVYEPAELPEKTGRHTREFSGMPADSVLGMSLPYTDTRLILPLCGYQDWRGYWETPYVYDAYLPDAYSQTADGSRIVLQVTNRRTGLQQLLLYEGENLRSIGSYAFEGQELPDPKAVEWFSQITISPSGRYVAFQSDRRTCLSGESRELDVWIYDIEREKEYLLRENAVLEPACWKGDLLYMHGPYNSPDEGCLYFRADPEEAAVTKCINGFRPQGRSVLAGKDVKMLAGSLGITDLETGAYGNFVFQSGEELNLRPGWILSDDGRYWVGVFTYRKQGRDTVYPLFGVADLSNGDTWLYDPPTSAYSLGDTAKLLRMAGSSILIQNSDAYHTYILNLGELPPAS